MKRNPLFAITLAVILSSCAGDEVEERQKHLRNVEVEDVLQEDFEHWVEVQGAVETQRDVFISPEMAGKIKSIRVEEGEMVNGGEVMAVIDSDIISKNIEELQTNLELAEFMYQKQKNLYNKGIGSEMEYQQALNQVKSLEKRLETLKAQAGKSVVVAPLSGVVETVFPTVGEMAAPQQPLFRLLNLEDMKVSAHISEAYLSQIKEGSKVRVEFPSIGLKMDSLEITKTGKFISEKNRTYKITIDLGNDLPEEIIPNLVARIYVRSEVAPEALVVPRRSLMFDKKGQTHVFKLSVKDTSKIAVKVPVDKLFSYGGYTAVESMGIKSGDKVITTGAEGLEDQAEVELLKE